jgi:hypothetical protein
VAAALLLGAVALAVLSSVSRSSGSRAQSGLSLPQPTGSVPTGWVSATTASRSATLFYPAGWRTIPGDRGTVSAAQRDRHGLYAAYLNATPRQGTEVLAGWAHFRTTRNRGEGDRNVRTIAAAENVRFAHASGSCVVDDYLSHIGGNPYRELACIVAGRHHTDVFVGATLRRDWSRLGGTIERAASALLER